MLTITWQGLVSVVPVHAAEICSGDMQAKTVLSGMQTFSCTVACCIEHAGDMPVCKALQVIPSSCIFFGQASEEPRPTVRG